MHYIWVGMGSALGGMARYFVGITLAARLGVAFPYGTLAVNALGSFLIVILMHLSLHTQTLPTDARLFLVTGAMGGFTTYSTFNYESIKLFEQGTPVLGMLNLVGTVLVCLVAGGLAWLLCRAL